MSVLCQCARARCQGFNPDEADRCPACPVSFRDRLAGSLKHLLHTSSATERAIARYLSRTPKPLRARRKDDK